MFALCSSLHQIEGTVYTRNRLFSCSFCLFWNEQSCWTSFFSFIDGTLHCFYWRFFHVKSFCDHPRLVCFSSKIITQFNNQLWWTMGHLSITLSYTFFSQMLPFLSLGFGHLFACAVRCPYDWCVCALLFAQKLAFSDAKAIRNHPTRVRKRNIVAENYVSHYST